MKYSLSHWEIPLALPSRFPSGSGYFSLYIPTLVTKQIQYSAVHCREFHYKAMHCSAVRDITVQCIVEHYTEEEHLA